MVLNTAFSDSGAPCPRSALSCPTTGGGDPVVYLLLGVEQGGNGKAVER